MDTYPKFIVVDDPEEGICMTIGRVSYHRDLIWDGEKVLGGGWWKLSRNNKEITFHGVSDQFGRVDEEILKEVIKNNKVFLSFPGGSKKKFDKYFIDRQSEIIEVKVG